MSRNRFWLGVAAGFLGAVLLAALIIGGMVATNYAGLGQVARTLYLVRTHALQPVPLTKLAEGAARGMVEALGDPYSTYLDPDSFEALTQHVKGEYGGLGMLIGHDAAKKLVVVSPFRGGPAHRAGVLPGDEIVAIDGQEASSLDLDVAARLIQGEPGTRVNVRFRRGPEGKVFDLTLVREVIKIPSVQSFPLEGYPEVGYVAVTMFHEGTAGEFRRAIEELQRGGIKGLVLDLRNNPGGSLDAAVEIAGYFTPPGPVVYIATRGGTVPYKSPVRSLGYPVVVLVNRGSASASEIVAGAIKDTGSGILVGERTFGKGLVQTLFEVEGGCGLRLTTAKYLTPTKRDIDAVGISPDVEVALDPGLETRVLAGYPDFSRDPQLREGVKLLLERLSQSA